jgi:hypothetical protein
VERILRVTATVWRGAADAAASMKPEDLKPEDRDRLRELATLKVLWELLAAAKKNLDIVTWRREGFPEAEDFLHALESGGLHPLLEKWQELRRTIAANRPVPDPLDSNARRLTVLLAETLSRTGLGEGEAREKTAEAVKRIFPKKAKRRKGRPSILVDIDDDAIRYWQSAYPKSKFTPDDEKLIAGAIKRYGVDHRHIAGWFVGLIRLAIDPVAIRRARPRLFER